MPHSSGPASILPTPPQTDPRGSSSVARGFATGAAAAAHHVTSPFAAGLLGAAAGSVAADDSARQRAGQLQEQHLKNTLLNFKVQEAQRIAALGDPETTAAFDLPAQGPLAETLGQMGLTLSANRDGKMMVRTGDSRHGVPLSPSVVRQVRSAGEQQRNAAMNGAIHGVLIQDLADGGFLADTDDEEQNANASAALRAIGRYLDPNDARTFYTGIRTARLGGKTMAEIRAAHAPILGQARDAREDILRDARRVNQQRVGHLNTLTAADVVVDPLLLMGAEALLTKPLMNVTDAELSSFRGKVDDMVLATLFQQRDSLRREQNTIMRNSRMNMLDATIMRPLSGPGNVLEADAGVNPENGFGATIIERTKLSPEGQTDDPIAFASAAQAVARDALWEEFPPEYIEALMSRDPDLQHLFPAGPPAPTPGSLVLPDGTIVTSEELDSRAVDLGFTPVELRRQLRERGAFDPGATNATP